MILEQLAKRLSLMLHECGIERTPQQICEWLTEDCKLTGPKHLQEVMVTLCDEPKAFEMFRRDMETFT